MNKDLTRTSGKKALGGFLTLLFLAFPLGAAPREPGLKEQVEILTEEVEKLKLKKAIGKYESREGLGPAASKVYTGPDGFSFGGYGELQYTDYLSSFKKDQVDVKRFILYAGYKFSDKLVFNSEIEYEHAGFETNSFVSDVDFDAEKTTKKSNNKAEVFVEFAYLDFKFSEKAKLALGLQLVPFGITNYLHEPITFYSVNRPQSEKNIIPTTWREIGALLKGKFKSGLSYRAGILNGPRGKGFDDSSFMRGGRTKGSKASAEHLAFVVNVEFDTNKGLVLGASFYQGDSGQGEIADLSWKDRVNDPLELLPAGEIKDTLKARRDKANKSGRARVHMAEAHFRYSKGPFAARGLFVRGYLGDADARALNRATGKNIGRVVEGGYLEVGYNILSLFKSKKKLYAFVRLERVNTQKETIRRYAGGREDQVDFVCKSVLNNTCRSVSNKDLGIINARDARKESYGVQGVADGVNDRSIVTMGLAYFPHPNVVLKLDYERWNSRVSYPDDLEWRNTANNKIDQVNFGVGFIF